MIKITNFNNIINFRKVIFNFDFIWFLFGKLIGDLFVKSILKSKIVIKF
jgi:hypothetical protein